MRIDAVIASCDDILTMAKRLENVSCLSEPILYTCQLLIGNIQASVACLLQVVKEMPLAIRLSFVRSIT